MEPSPTLTSSSRSLRRAIITSGLLVGTLDIMAATIQGLIAGGNPIRLLKFISSGVFGREVAMAGGIEYALYGLIFHYFIAMSWTVLFFMIYPRIKVLARNVILTGISYGIFVWLMMNLIVVPLSNVTRGPMRLQGSLIGAAILIVAIGIPLSFMARNYFKAKV